MDHPCDHFLAGAGGATDQHARTGRRHALNAGPQATYCRTVSSQPGLRPGTQAQLRVFAGQCCRFQGTQHHQQEAIRLERLFDEVVGALLDCRDCSFDRAMAGNHDHRHVRFLAVERLQQSKTVQARPLQPHVQDHQRRPPHTERCDRCVGVAGTARFVPFVAQDAVDQQTDVGFVIDDQDIKRHPTPSQAEQVRPPLQDHRACHPRSADLHGLP